MIASKFVIALLSPLGASLALFFLALILNIAGLRRISFGIALVGLLWLWVWSLPVTSLAFRAALEGQYPSVEMADLEACDAAVVLGGAVTPAGGRFHYPDLRKAADRLFVAARAYHAGKAPLLVLSGGSSPVSEAEAMRAVLREFGVPDAAMLLEGRSRDTRENARFSAELLRERGIERVLLVTSALHMRRALRHFAYEGIEALPVSTDHEARGVSEWQRWIPDTDALDGSARAIKEWVGQHLPPSWG